MYLEKYFAFSFLVFTLIGSSLYASEPLAFIHREWDYIEEVLIIKPMEDAQTKLKHHKWLAPLFGAGVSSFTSYKFLQHILYPYYKSDESSREILDYIMPLYGGLFGFLLGNKFYCRYRNMVFEQFVYENFLTIIEQWPKHQKYIPACFHAAFNECVELFHIHGSNNSAWRKKADSMISALQKAIMNHFAQKYYRSRINNTVLVM
ncbi:MAG: hypothetical protein WDZ41_04090 [Candidatus Babeliales bacterium]